MPSNEIIRRVEWSLRAFASRRTVCAVFRARAVIKFIFRAPSTLENADGELQAIRNFSANRNLFCF